MKEKKVKLCLWLLSLGLVSQAQQASTATGGSAGGSSGSVAYSVGQTCYTPITETSGSVNEGVQQAYEIYTVGIAETEWNMSLCVFPNPTSDMLILEFNDSFNESLSYQIFDLLGKQLTYGQIQTKQTQINVRDLAASTYFVNITNHENKTIQSFKIIKS
jgi:hypothetical protein